MVPLWGFSWQGNWNLNKEVMVNWRQWRPCALVAALPLAATHPQLRLLCGALKTPFRAVGRKPAAVADSTAAWFPRTPHLFLTLIPVPSFPAILR